MKAMKNTQTEVDQAYAYLHDAIVQGSLLPNQRLIEMDLAEQLGVGRAAIRTALDRLSQDGLVVREPNRGAHVRLITLAEAVEMLEVRAVLEGLVARHAAHHATEADVATLEAIIQRMADRLASGGLLTISALNIEFHAKLLEIANHATVTALLERLQASHVRYQFRMLLAPGRAYHSLEEHRAIVAAVTARNPVQAEEAMRSHLAHSAEALRHSGEVLSTQILH